MIYFESGATGTYGTNYPRIGWNSITRRGTISASTEATGYPATNAASPFEYSYWQATSTAAQSLTLTFTAEDVNFVGIAAHNLGTAGATVQVQNNPGSWTTIGPTMAPTDDSPIGVILTDRTMTQIRLNISGMTVAPYIGVFYVCEVLEFPVKTYAGQGSPANMARSTEYMTNETLAGKYTGRSIKRQRNRVDVPVRHFSETWAAANFDDFAEDARSYPYFLMPRPADYPKDIQFKWSQSDLVPERMGIGGNLMQVTI